MENLFEKFIADFRAPVHPGVRPSNCKRFLQNSHLPGAEHMPAYIIRIFYSISLQAHWEGDINIHFLRTQKARPEDRNPSPVPLVPFVPPELLSTGPWWAD